MIPDREACLALLREAGCTDEIVHHVQAVERLALALAAEADDVDRALVRAGALLHDVGRALDHGPDHVTEGITFLRQHGVDEAVVRAVARHMGAGIEPAQARAWGWPTDESYLPETLEERIVCHADNLTFDTDHVRLADVLEKLERRGLSHLVPRMRALHEGLARELGVDPDAVSGSVGT